MTSARESGLECSITHWPWHSLLPQPREQVGQTRCDVKQLCLMASLRWNWKILNYFLIIQSRKGVKYVYKRRKGWIYALRQKGGFETLCMGFMTLTYIFIEGKILFKKKKKENRKVSKLNGMNQLDHNSSGWRKGYKKPHPGYVPKHHVTWHVCI